MLTGEQSEILNNKQTYQVLLASKATWRQSATIQILQTMALESLKIKDDFKHLMLLGIKEKPHYKIPTAKDIIYQITSARKGIIEKL
jgi:hypothetical protein